MSMLLSCLTSEQMQLNVSCPPQTDFPHTVIQYDDPYTPQSNYKSRSRRTRPDTIENNANQPIICNYCHSIALPHSLALVILPKTKAAKLQKTAIESKDRNNCYVCLDGAHMPNRRHSLPWWEWRIHELSQEDSLVNQIYLKKYKKTVSVLKTYLSMQNN